MKNNIFLIINPGSTSTKIAIYKDEQALHTISLTHNPEELDKFSRIIGQFDFRKELILKELANREIDLNSITAVIARGGNMKPVEGGTYLINQSMVEDLEIGVMGQHASNLGGVIAHSIALSLGIESYVVDPVVVDEFEKYARISGMPLIERKSKDHPLNQKAAARMVSKEIGRKYQDLNFVVAHLGGGISVGSHKKGRIIDVNNALDGDGPLSPERSGSVPIGSLVDICFSGDYSKDEVKKMITGKGGLVGYLGTNDGRTVRKRISEGDDYAELIYKTMAYQVSKEIGSAATVLMGEVDAIVLTGGIAYDDEFISWVKERVSFIAPVKVIPGENEMEALAQGVLRILRKEESLRDYK